MSETIIVIGAGMAGIMAAKTLQDNGYNVTILEARSRIGGRTHTDHSLGIPVDLGGAWIHGADGNPLRRLAKNLGIQTGYTDFLNRTITAVQAYDEDGTPLDQTEYAEGLRLGLASEYLAYGSELHTPPTSRNLEELLASGLPKPDSLTHAEEQGFRYQTEISHEYVSAADMHEINLALEDTYVDLPGGDELVHGGGFNAITDHLASGLEIKLNTPVSAITVTDKKVLVQTTGSEREADRVIVTVPLGVLQSGGLRFTPPLPQTKTEAINRIGFGNYEKIAMRFDKFYWDNAPQRFNYFSTGDPSLFHAWLNIGHYTNEPIIVSYHAGRRARTINSWSDEKLITEAVNVMQTMFGQKYGEIPRPISYARTSWESDPYSLGSYSFDKVGQQLEDRRTYANPVGDRLFFAGEASHPTFSGTVHGAYETGIRAAQEIMDIGVTH